MCRCTRTDQWTDGGQMDGGMGAVGRWADRWVKKEYQGEGQSPGARLGVQGPCICSQACPGTDMRWAAALGCAGGEESQRESRA